MLHRLGMKPLRLYCSLTELRKEALVSWYDGIVERKPALDDAVDEATDCKPAER